MTSPAKNSVYLTPPTGQQKKIFFTYNWKWQHGLNQVKEHMFVPWSSSFYLRVSPPDNLVLSSHRSLKKSAALWMDAYYETWCRCQPWCACNCISQGGWWMCKNFPLTCRCHWHTGLWQECELQGYMITLSLKVSSANKKQREHKMAFTRVSNGKWSPMLLFFPKDH